MLLEMSEEELYKAQDLSLNLAALWNVLENRQTKPIMGQKKKKRKHSNA